MGSNQVQRLPYRCLCCGEKNHISIPRDDDPAEYDMRRICNSCKADECHSSYRRGATTWGREKTRKRKPPKYVQDGNGKPVVLRGKAFRQAAAECTPILLIRNQAEPAKYVTHHRTHGV